MQPRDLVFFRLDKAVARILDGFPEDCKIQRVLIILNVEFFRNGVDIGDITRKVWKPPLNMPGAGRAGHAGYLKAFFNHTKPPLKGFPKIR
jgi:hypothetical protein